MLGNLPAKDIEEVLTHQVMGRIGCHDDNTTYVIPISYAYDGKYIYGHTTNGMKIKMMRSNPSVCFEVEEIRDMANWKSIILWGTFEELSAGIERTNALQKLVDRILPLISSETTHLSPHWPFPPENISVIKGIVFRIAIKKKTGRFETNEITGVAMAG